mmetsp:Transcript_22782/g.58026  ORF Transcript_22782/g.58026 Transcript_22782/m.58026 type:complete len:204 (-) Transcript_22782:21-632(-)
MRTTGVASSFLPLTVLLASTVLFSFLHLSVGVGACESVSGLHFCSHINYRAYVLGGQTPEGVDQMALTTFYSSNGPTLNDCCRQVYKEWVCAELFPMCNVSDVALPTCNRYLCSAKERVNVAKTQQCFFQLYDVACSMFQSTWDADGYNTQCTCPNGDPVLYNYDCVLNSTECVYVNTDASSTLTSSLLLLAFSLSLALFALY